MRTFRLLFPIALIISVIFLSSCSNDSSPTNPDGLSVSFTMDKTTAIIGEVITFTNTSQNATSFAWDFGDGNSSTEENPTHSYSSTGTFTITLTANGEEGSRSKTKFITIVNPVFLNLTIYRNSYQFQGPTSFKAGPVELHFYNQSSGSASANLVKHDDGYSHQDMLNLFVNGYTESHHPSWSTEIQGVWKVIDANKSHTWTGNLSAGLYTLVACKINPLGAWYGAGLTVE